MGNKKALKHFEHLCNRLKLAFQEDDSSCKVEEEYELEGKWGDGQGKRWEGTEIKPWLQRAFGSGIRETLVTNGTFKTCVEPVTRRDHRRKNRFGGGKVSMDHCWVWDAQKTSKPTLYIIFFLSSPCTFEKPTFRELKNINIWILLLIKCLFEQMKGNYVFPQSKYHKAELHFLKNTCPNAAKGIVQSKTN